MSRRKQKNKKRDTVIPVGNKREEAHALYLQGQTPSEIAAKLGVKPKDVSNWAHRDGWGEQRQEIKRDVIEHVKKTLFQQVESNTELAAQVVGELLKRFLAKEKVSEVALVTAIKTAYPKSVKPDGETNKKSALAELFEDLPDDDDEDAE